MLCLDRVFCNSCGCFIGQVFYQPAEAPDLLHDLGAGLNFTVCPDCRCTTQPCTFAVLTFMARQPLSLAFN